MSVRAYTDLSGQDGGQPRRPAAKETGDCAGRPRSLAGRNGRWHPRLARDRCLRAHHETGALAPRPSRFLYRKEARSHDPGEPLLDDVEEALVKEVDTSNMLDTVLGSAKQMRDILADPARFKVPDSHRGAANVLITGLGGSAIGGDYLAHWAERNARVPVVVNRTYDIPKWVGPDTLVITSSYSGNTEETLAAFGAAHAAKARILAISTGGKIEQFATKTGSPFIRLPGGYQPRAALPTGFTTTALALEACGVLDARSALESAAGELEKLAPELALDKSPPRNVAKQLAVALRDTTPVIYAADHLVPSARRFANQLNENSKVLAFWGVMPEMNHNELVGWDGESDLSRFTAVFLRHEGERDQIRKRYEYTAKTIMAHGGQVVQIDAQGKGIPSELLTTTLIGDVTSVLLAALRKIDPTPVTPISGLKDAVGKLGLATSVESTL